SDCFSLLFNLLLKFLFLFFTLNFAKTFFLAYKLTKLFYALVTKLTIFCLYFFDQLAMLRQVKKPINFSLSHFFINYAKCISNHMIISSSNTTFFCLFFCCLSPLSPVVSSVLLFFI